jgi:hypothetical protein
MMAQIRHVFQKFKADILKSNIVFSLCMVKLTNTEGKNTLVYLASLAYFPYSVVLYLWAPVA